MKRFDYNVKFNVDLCTEDFDIHIEFHMLGGYEYIIVQKATVVNCPSPTAVVIPDIFRVYFSYYDHATCSEPTGTNSLPTPHFNFSRDGPDRQQHRL